MASFLTKSSFFTFDSGHALVNLTETSFWYATAYQIAFFFGLAIFIYAGIRRKYPLNTWLLIAAAASFLLVTGSKVGTLSINDWRLFFQEGVLVASGKKTAIGAIVLIVACLWLVARALRFKAPIWGAFAFFLPVVMLTQRVGCLLAGCCYGKPIASAGGVKYFGPSMIRDQQIHHQLITQAQDITQAVHNVPLYFMGVALLTIAFLLVIQKRIGNGKALLFVAIMGMGAGRFFVEFFRDPMAHSMPQAIYYGLTPQQWLIAVFVIVVGVLLHFELKKAPQQAHAPDVFPLRNLVFMLGLSIATLLLRDWFTNYEKVVVYAQLLIAGALNIKTIWETEHRMKPIWAPLSLFLLSTVVIAQEVPNDSVWQQPGKTYLKGTFTQNRLTSASYPCTQIESGCVGDYCALADSASIHGVGYSSGQIGLEHQFKSNGKSSFSLGIDLAGERYSNFEANRNLWYMHASPYLKISSKFISLTLGARVGQLYSPIYIRNRGVYYALPRAGIRLGNQESRLLIDGGFRDEYLPNGIMPAQFSSSLSIRAVRSNAFVMRVGFSLGYGDFGNNSFNTHLGMNLMFYDRERDLTLIPSFGFASMRGADASQRFQNPQFALQLRTRIFKD